MRNDTECEALGEFEQGKHKPEHKPEHWRQVSEAAEIGHHHWRLAHPVELHRG